MILVGNKKPNDKLEMLDSSLDRVIINCSDNQIHMLQ